MDDMLKNILDMDKQAREKIEELEQYRLDAMASLSDKKAEIMKAESQKAIQSAQRKSEKRKSEGEKHLKEIHERNEKIIENMNSLYNQNADKWVEEIVAKTLAQ